MVKQGENKISSALDEQQKRQDRITTLGVTLAALVITEGTQSEMPESLDEASARRAKITHAGHALAAVLTAAPSDDPMLWDIVSYVYGVDNVDLSAEYFRLRDAGVIIRDGLGYRLGDPDPQADSVQPTV